MYARGMSAREIQGHLRDLYGVDVSADLVSAVTDAVLDEIAEWQNRPLERLYALVFFDAIRVKVRDEGMVRICVGKRVGIWGYVDLRWVEEIRAWLVAVTTTVAPTGSDRPSEDSAA